MKRYNPERREEFVRENLEWIPSAFKRPSTIWWKDKCTFVEEIDSDLFTKTFSRYDKSCRYFLLNQDKVNFEYFEIEEHCDFVRIRAKVKINGMRTISPIQFGSFEGYLYLFRPDMSFENSCIIELSSEEYGRNTSYKLVSGRLIKSDDGTYHEEILGSLTKSAKN